MARLHKLSRVARARLCVGRCLFWFKGWDTAVMVGVGLIVIGAIGLGLLGCQSTTRIDGASSSAVRETTTTREWEWGGGK